MLLFGLAQLQLHYLTLYAQSTYLTLRELQLTLQESELCFCSLQPCLSLPTFRQKVLGCCQMHDMPTQGKLRNRSNVAYTRDSKWNAEQLRPAQAR